MKTTCIALLLVFTSSTLFAQNSWSAKSDFGGTERVGAVGFFITSTNKAYILTGLISGLSESKDFWEYDVVSNNWTKKADFLGSARAGGVGFSIGNKGYVGTGYSFLSGYLQDFWEYNPATNTWTQKTNFPGSPRKDAVGFAIGSKGYIG